jgi:PASTA domain.
MSRYDLITFARALLVSLGAGLLGGAIGYFVMRDRADWHRKRPVLLMALGGCVLLSTVALSALWHYLVTVPVLDGLSRARAEETLVGMGLVPEARPQHAAGVEVGRVVPKSQTPNAGQEVRPETVVLFAVATGPSEAPSSTRGTDAAQLPTVSLFEPTARATFRAARRPDGVGTITARGTSTGMHGSTFQLLLWLRPVNPPSDVSGWYLQRPPGNGVAGVDPDGAWQGVAQVGNSQWPPQEGAVIDLAVSVADRETATRLMAESGVVVRPDPVGVATTRATAVVLTFK